MKASFTVIFSFMYFIDNLVFIILLLPIFIDSNIIYIFVCYLLMAFIGNLKRKFK